MARRRLRQAEIQDHFQYQKVISGYLAKPDLEKDRNRVYYVTDKRGRTSKATSNEYFVAGALDIIGLEYVFQLSIAGGKSLSFGIILDFLVETVPLPTPLWVQGDYWHTGARRQKDLRQQDIVRQYMGGAILEPIEIWGHESNSAEAALSAIRRSLL